MNGDYHMIRLLAKSGDYGPASQNLAEGKVREDESCLRNRKMFCHTFHWSEILFLFMILGSAFVFILEATDIKLPSLLVVIALVLTSIIAMGVNCGLAAQRKIARNVHLIQQTVVSMMEVNKRLAHEADELEDVSKDVLVQERRFKRDVEKLGGKVESFQALEQRQKKILESEREIIRERKRITDHIDNTLNGLEHLTTEAARNHLLQRIRTLFQAANQDDDPNISPGREFNLMVELLQHNGIQLTESFEHLAKGKPVITWAALYRHLQHTVHKQFDDLIRVKQENRELERQVKDLEVQLREYARM